MTVSRITVVCKCPTCAKTYWQECSRRWIGKTWRVRAYEDALRVLCEENGQGRGKEVWAGYAYCTDCSLRRCPPALRETVRTWLEFGEFK